MSTSLNFLHIADLATPQLNAVVTRAAALKKAWQAGEVSTSLAGKTIALLFALPSTRTRLSFEAGVVQLGGAAFYIDTASTQLARNEPIADTAKVFGSMCDAVVLRHNEHAVVTEFAQHCKASVINALTPQEHPCQVLADVMTFIESRGPIQGSKIAWVGDCNNVCRSWIAAAKLLEFELAIAAPAGYDNPAVDLGPLISLTNDPVVAVRDAACVTTDVWTSMGDAPEKINAFANFTVTNELMSHAASDAIFMHCLPAHRGEEVAAEVIDGPQSVVWAEAENRMHVQKALLEELLTNQST